ncbi:hypothetical protein JCGZ_19540 [Jatropha curcas]|uniref:Uncharacterized protein n=1 Tax=Jatropha curcas TaxID=180498 RepID=A0A067K9M1_JATCU|nr:hypothetical protein JCGZ_19540 [Jatropha curcas]
MKEPLMHKHKDSRKASVGLYFAGKMSRRCRNRARYNIQRLSSSRQSYFRSGSGKSDHNEGTSDAQTQRQQKGKAPVTSSSHVEEEEDEVAGWKQELGKVEALQQSQETLQVTVLDMGQKLHTIQKNHERMEQKWMKYFHHQNIEFTPSPPDSPEA